MENERYVLELLKEQKNSHKRTYIALVLAILLLFVSNMTWLYFWTLPVDEMETTVTTSLESNDGGNANYINGNGDIKNGESNSN